MALQFIILDDSDIEKLKNNEAVGVSPLNPGIDPGIILCTEKGYEDFIASNDMVEIKRGKLKDVINKEQDTGTGGQN